MKRMILKLPILIDVNKFVDLVAKTVCRNGKKKFATPKVTWLRMGNKEFTVYAIDATEINSAFISAVQELEKEIPLKFYLESAGEN